MSQGEPLIITAAVVGAETMREDTPYVPYTPEEIAAEARLAREAGASIAHVHGRKADGTPTQDKETFSQILDKIQDRTDIIVQFSTGGAVGMDVEERIAGLQLGPEMATLTTGTVNFGNSIFANSLPTIKTIAERLSEYDITPEIEVFDSGMLRTANYLIDRGFLKPPLHFDFVMGMPGGIGPRPRDLEYLLEMLPEESTWSVAGIGKYELPLAREAIERGGHVRVGLEDNIYVDKNQLAEGNAELVERVVDMAESIGRDIANPDEAREMLKI